jgi:FixJ family two-component response regulator
MGVMPEMGGRETAERAAVLGPDMKVLFMSAHTQDVMMREVIEKGMPFLQKPFTPAKLAGDVRQVWTRRSARNRLRRRDAWAAASVKTVNGFATVLLKLQVTPGYRP